MCQSRGLVSRPHPKFFTMAYIYLNQSVVAQVGRPKQSRDIQIMCFASPWIIYHVDIMPLLTETWRGFNCLCLCLCRCQSVCSRPLLGNQGHFQYWCPVTIPVPWSLNCLNFNSRFAFIPLLPAIYLHTYVTSTYAPNSYPWSNLGLWKGSMYLGL